MDNKKEEFKEEIDKCKNDFNYWSKHHVKFNDSNKKTINEMFEDPEFLKMWNKMHTPYKRDIPKISRNEICPFCNSGKKFKNCECYKKYNKQTEY